MTSTDSSLAAIDSLLQPFTRSDAPGLIVGIARGGLTVYRRGVGMASIEQGVAMSPRTRVRIASTSKHFTSVAILLLAEDGRLDIDDLIYQHLPELERLHPAGPTLRQLMQHTGGWRTDLAALTQGLTPEPLADWSQPMRAMSRSLNFEPGTRMIYSNTGYQLLARVIERISRQALGDFLRERIFTPLGMHDTESVSSDFDIRPGMASQYQAMPPAAGGGLRRGIYPGELRGSGSLVSTVDDMLRWLAHMRRAAKSTLGRPESTGSPSGGRTPQSGGLGSTFQVGSAQSWAQMLARPTLSTGMELPYALGLFRHDYRGVEVVHHSGAVLGATAQMITVPSQELDIMILANGASVSTVALGFQIIDALLGDALSAPATAHVPAEPHAAVIGKRYHAAATGAVLGFEDLGGKLAFAWMGNRGVPLRQSGDSALMACEDVALNPVLIPLEALRAASAPATLTISDGGHLLHCELLPDTGPGGLASELVGVYSVPDLEGEARVEAKGDEITVRLQGPNGHNVYRLRPLSSEVMLAEPLDPLFVAIGGGAIVNIEREGGRVAALRLDASRVRGLRFIRDDAEARA